MKMENEITASLIAFVQDCPHLYDKKHPDFKDAVKRDNSWKSIAEVLNMTVEDCQTRWKSLRDRYCRELKKLDAPSGSGATNVTESSRQLLINLSFLRNVVHHRRSSGNYAESTSTSETAASRRPIPSVSPRPVPSVSPRPVPSVSPRPGPSASPRPVPSVSPRPVPSVSPRPVPSVSPRPVPSVSPRPVPSASPRPVPSVSPRPVPSVSPYPVPSASPHPVPSVSPPLVPPVMPCPELSDFSCPSTAVSSRSYSRSTSSGLEEDHEDAYEMEGTEEWLEYDILEEAMQNEGVPEEYEEGNFRAPIDAPPKKKRKTLRNDDVNSAIVDTLKTITELQKNRHTSILEEDALFANSLALELKRFPPRKKNYIKGHIMMFLSEQNDEELQ